MNWAASYHLARSTESQNEVRQAVHFTRVPRLNNAYPPVQGGHRCFLSRVSVQGDLSFQEVHTTPVPPQEHGLTTSS